jgi:uncharacterized BrkB/YihY/UPF0761 family membrane protein
MPIGRLALELFRRYFEATRNSGSAAAIYLFLSVGPLLLAAAGLLHVAGDDTNVLARHFIDHHHLTGDTARIVRETFGTVANNALAASVVAVIGFVLWGVSVGQIYQDFYARAWRIHVRTVADQARFAIWFLVLSGLLGVFFVVAGDLKRSGWAAVVPAWLLVSTGFWLWTPRYLLHKTIGLRALLPGALLATIVLGGATATSPFFLGPTLNADGRRFGSFGVVLALIAWGYVLATISLVCAVFSPVWRESREAERRSPEEPAETAPEAHAALSSEAD